MLRCLPVLQGIVRITEELPKSILASTSPEEEPFFQNLLCDNPSHSRLLLIIK
jgi:hypothetical protein